MSEPQFLVERLPPIGRFRLEGREGHHAADVQRLKAGQSLLLGDGMGGVASARVVVAGRGAVDVDILTHRTLAPPDTRLTVIQGIPKADRGEYAVQAMTEVGVDEIVPWAASRSVVQWKGERGERSYARWRSTAREATKQSRRSWIPTIAPPLTTTSVSQRLRSCAAACVLHEEASLRLTDVDLPSRGEICLVVGPEGGISEEELERFQEAGAVAVVLGSAVLRTSTAGLAAICVVSTRLKRW